MSRGPRLARAAVLAALAASTAFAQDGGSPPPFDRERQLLAMKLEAKRVFPPRPFTDQDLDFAAAAEARAVRCASAGDTAGELAALTDAVRRIEGAPDDDWSGVAATLLPRLATALLDDETTVELRFEWLPQSPPRPRPIEPCAVEVMLARGTPYGAGGELQRVATLARRSAVDFSAAPPSPFTLALPPSFAGAGFITVALRLADGQVRRLSHPARVARQPGLRAAVAALEARREALRTAPGPSDGARERALALTALPAALLEQVARGDRQLQEALLDAEFESAGELLDALAAGNAAAGERGLIRRVHRHPTTGELLPWLAYVPATVAAAIAGGAPAPVPLVVALHGLGAREESWFQYGGGLLAREAEARGLLVVAPHGWRTDSFYVGHGETDVLAVIEEACATWPIDRDRICLLGHSMGAMGALRIAARAPGRFAAVAAIAGGGLASWVPQLRDLPIGLVHGDADTVVPIALSRALAAVARANGRSWWMMELAGADHVSVVASALPEVLDFCLNERRRDG